MSEQEKISVGDIVKIVRNWETFAGGCGLTCLADGIHKIGNTGRVLSTTCGAGNVSVESVGYVPPSVLEIISKANGTKPMKETEIVNIALNLIKGEQNMSTKTQDLYPVAVTQNVHVKGAETGLIESTRKEVLFKDAALPAFTKQNAATQAVVETIRSHPKATAKVVELLDSIDWHEVEVKVSDPF